MEATSHEMNLRLQELNLQNAEKPLKTPGKYSKGFNIYIDKEGDFAEGVDLKKDVLPIIDELKHKWNTKVH